MKQFKPLSIDEIDFRVQSINKGGYATILAYKDARADMNRLDEVYGSGYWQKKYELINGNLFCHVGIWNKELQQWVWICDVGTESNTEKEKGQASDAFKRACFNLGIGRELYDYPVIQIKLKQDEFKIENYNGKEVVKSTFALKLKEWTWLSKFNDDGKIEMLTAIDNNGKERFAWSEKIKTTLYNHKEIGKPEKPLISNEQFKHACDRMRLGEDIYNKVVNSFSLTEEQLSLLNQLKK